MAYHFNHRFGDFALLGEGEREHILPHVPESSLAQCDYITRPRYWVPQHEVESRLADIWPHRWLLGWRDVTDSRSSVRTLVSALLPLAGVGHKFPLLMPSAEPQQVAALYANLCSFVLDYATRQKVGGTSLTYFIFKQLPVLPPTAYDSTIPWYSETGQLDWIGSRVLELTYTAWDLEAFALDCGYDGSAVSLG